MKQLIIVIDEASDNSKGFGPSLAYWVAYLYDPSKETHPTALALSEAQRYEVAVLMEVSKMEPLRSGAIFSGQGTAIMICLDGIVRALESCHLQVSRLKPTEIIICGDCKAALDMAAGRQARKNSTPKAFGKRIDAYRDLYKKAGIPVSFRYIDDQKYPLLKTIDGAAKYAKATLEKLGKK